MCRSRTEARREDLFASERRVSVWPTDQKLLHRTILLDCGKTFREAALKWFPHKGFRRIDACILTRALISRY